MADRIPVAWAMCAISDLFDPKSPTSDSKPKIVNANEAARTFHTPHIDTIWKGEAKAPIPSRPVTPAEDPRHQWFPMATSANAPRLPAMRKPDTRTPAPKAISTAGPTMAKPAQLITSCIKESPWLNRLNGTDQIRQFARLYLLAMKCRSTRGGPSFDERCFINCELRIMYAPTLAASNAATPLYLMNDMIPRVSGDENLRIIGADEERHLCEMGSIPCRTRLLRRFRPCVGGLLRMLSTLFVSVS